MSCSLVNGPRYMTDREATRVGSYYNPIILSDDEDDGGSESDYNSYISLEVIMRSVLRIGMPDRDDEVLQEFDRAR